MVETGSMVRHIVHLDIPDFYALMEELRNPELRKRPLALAEPGPRAVVQGVNSAARTEDIREGMLLSHARRLCRGLVAIPPDIRFYRERHGGIMEELGRFSPLVEGTSQGHYFVDLTGTQRLWGPCPDVACRMEKHLAEKNGMHARVGLASSKLVSQVAANCITPGDLSCIFPGGETSFLTPLPVTLLPGVGFKTASRLANFNIQRIGQLAALPAEAVSSVFGKPGFRLVQIARGIDADPVIPSRETPRLCMVRNLERDEVDRNRLEAVLFQQAEEAGWVLRRRNRSPGRAVIEIRHADGVTARSRFRLPPITAHLDYRLFELLRAAFDRLVQRRIAIRRIALEFSDFSMPPRQMSLFPWEETALETDRRLQNALDGIRRRFGREAIRWGRTASAPACHCEDF